MCDSKVCKGRGKVELHAVKAARRMKDGSKEVKGLACSECFKQALQDGQIVRKDGSIRKVQKRGGGGGGDGAAAADKDEAKAGRVLRSQSKTVAAVELTPEERTLLSLHRNSKAKGTAGGQ